MCLEGQTNISQGQFLKNGIFSRMLHCKVLPRDYDSHENELGDDGARKFWEATGRILREQVI